TGFEPVPALHSDRRRAQTRHLIEATREQGPQVLVGRVARRPDRRVYPTAALQDRQVVGPASAGHELIPALSGVAEVRVWIDEAGRHDRAIRLHPQAVTTPRVC